MTEQPDREQEDDTEAAAEAAAEGAAYNPTVKTEEN